MLAEPEYRRLNIQEMKNPRSGRGADKAGAYLLASRVASNVVDIGGYFEFEHFITGYGLIGDSKLTGYISSNIFDVSDSKVTHSLTLNKDNDIQFGGVTQIIDVSRFYCSMAGAQTVNWKESTLFFDLDNKPCPAVSTEVRVNDTAPFSWKLKLSDGIKPGEYTIDFYFTYFNGEKWQCSKDSVKFKVRSFFERNSAQISYFGLTATALGLLMAGAKFFIR